MSTQRERGMSTAIEAVIVIPVLVVIMGVVTAGFRLWQTRAELQQTATAAARAGSLARSGHEATARIQAVVAANGGTCTSPGVEADVAGFKQPPGTLAQVSVQLTCVVRFDDLLVPGVPGSTTVVLHASSPLDTYRERGR